ncbi:Cinnamoyl-coa reductase [Thalictrum thalictroides]|uniref:Cinnamoyl-coa reductase n=1 Tax=Thalictrum thalictroides TaxID=46969 RepID=A0A7J6UY05_THATH|nr:Cinnamoyl-coa reductase [Thalictrum thalictroides]
MEIIEPAVTGTSYVLKACSMEKVKRVVVVSSIAAVMHNPNWPKDQPMDESCWSDEEFCKTLEDDPYNWYYLAKTIAERQALEYGKKTGLDVVTVCPSIILGPMLQSTTNASSLFIYTMLKGLETMKDQIRMVVDVRDTAEALLLVYENPEAEGRYICSSYTMRVREFVDKLKSMYPNYNYPKQITEVDEVLDLTSEKLQKLGWRYRSLEETIKDSVKNYKERGMLE